VLTPPDDLPDAALARVLADGWGLGATSIDYRAVGFGSHHWHVVDADGVRRFVTVDDLDSKCGSVREPDDSAFDRLRAALATATDLRRSGAGFVVAPLATRGGEPVMRLDRRFAVALYPYVDGQSYAWDEPLTPAHRRGLLDLIVALHTVPMAALRHPVADDFAIPYRDGLQLALENRGMGSESGPYADRASRLLVGNKDKIARRFRRYDSLVEQGQLHPGRAVITHGEPHPGNTIGTADGWVLIDWDTVLVAPAERDLWSLDPGDGSIISAYQDSTATVVLESMLELYRLRWDLADIAVYARHFRAPHGTSLDDEKSWANLSSLIAQLPV
jgi:spectinomycin phosphotransferase/16S rRNA (guanine(1405)-N(7))-methyltransferase